MIYRYCTPAGFDILLNLRLKASQISEFNDPFELALGVQIKTAEANIQKDFEERPDLLADWKVTMREQKISFQEDSIEDIIQKVAAFQISDLRRVAELIRNEWNDKLGVACFSRDFDIIQMWAHYADDHKGIIIGIDEKVLTSKSEELFDIEYKNELTRIPVFANPENIPLYEPYIKQALHRKEEKWSYEKEVRVYIDLDKKSPDGRFYIGITADAVKEIYLGLRVHETTEIIAKEIVNRPKFRHLKLFKMSMHSDEYKLVRTKIEM
ncbi:DUF2971 domain-containing protein [Methylobacter tundripaludum]|uniref:DUF2971 domain-containing protein n=1 Tax=Methylobacter tundripaludum TaxID=173365 RepID=UPI0004896058|nr:DUF2971 domain-containing protein [Methylobacter tundripaludum]